MRIATLIVYFKLLFSFSYKDCLNDTRCWLQFRDVHDKKSTPEIYSRAYDVAKSLKNYQETPRIPKIIHQIWLEGPVPIKFKRCIYSWKESHPHWEYRLWTEKEIKKIKIYNNFIYKTTTDLNLKMEILKLELLHQFGGVCVNIDQESIYPFDIFHHISDLYLGFCHGNSSTKKIINSNVIGAAKGHEFIKRAIVDIRLNIGNLKNDNDPEGVEFVGPNMITRVFNEFVITNSKAFLASPWIVLPKPFFTPLDVKNLTYDEFLLDNEFLMHYIDLSTYSINCLF